VEIEDAFWFNNKVSLTKLYNQLLSDARQDKEVDFVLFMHADVKLDF